MGKLQYIGVLCLAWITYNVLTTDDDSYLEEISGTNVLITGASRGIGESLAYQYSRLGANVFITARSGHQLKEVVKNCKLLGRKDAKFGYLEADMEDYETSSKTVVNAAVKLLGGIDHLILNHAFLHTFQSWKNTPEDLKLYKKMIDTNVLSHIHLFSHSLSHLKSSSLGGKVAVVSSMAGKLDVAFMAPYSSSKFALDGFFSSVRQELTNEKENISITLCVLGHIDTPAASDMFNDLEENFNVDVSKMKWLIPFAPVPQTALEIIKATVQGQRELYYPPLFGSTCIVKMFPVLRHVWPSLVEFDISRFQKS